jgi:hypothetical protein
MDPIEVVVEDRRLGKRRIVGRIEPPQVRRGNVDEIEFSVREIES